MGIEESFHLHPFFFTSFISLTIFIINYFLRKRVNWNIDIYIAFFIVGFFVMVIGAIFSFSSKESNYVTLSSEVAEVYVNDKEISCVNVNGVEFPIIVNGAEFEVDGITVLNWTKDNGNDSIRYVYLQEEEDVFFKGSPFKRDGIRIQITNYKVFKYEMEATMNESLAGAKKLKQ